MISIKLAARNIKMNFKRYVMLCVVFFVATVALIFNFIGADALKTSMEDACIRIFTGNVMIKNIDYDFRLGMAESGTPNLIKDVDSLIEKCESQSEVTGCVARIRRGVQVSAEKSEYMNLLGVDVDREIKFSEFSVNDGKDKISTGEALISQTYLDKLDLSIGDKVDINTVSADGAPIREKFKIVGIINNTNMNFLRQDSIIISYSDALALLKEKNVATEILVYTDKKQVSKGMLDNLNNIINDKAIKAYSWEDMGSEIVYASLGSYASILFLALACSVIICALVYNLTAMSIFSQMRTIGTMLALGMTHGKVLLKFIWENIIIGISSCACGALLVTIGIEMVGSEKIPMGVAAEIFGSEFLSLRMDVGLICLVAIGVALLSVISTLIAFNKIRKIQPIKAIVQ